MARSHSQVAGSAAGAKSHSRVAEYGKRRRDTGASARRSVRPRCKDDWWTDKRDFPQEELAGAKRPALGAQRRECKLGAAFANWRRKILHELRNMMKKKADISRGDKSSASLAQLVWTEEDMEVFLRTVASYDAHKKSWLAERKARTNKTHPLHSKAMPRLIPATFVCLYQLVLAQTYSKKFMEHFGHATVGDMLHTPIQVRAEIEGVRQPDFAVATEYQITLFEQNTATALKEISASLGAAEVASYVEQAQAYKGDGLFKFVLELARKHVDDRTPKDKTPSPFRSRLLYEYIIGTAFHSAQMEKQKAERRDWIKAACQNKSTKPSFEETEMHVNEDWLEKIGDKDADAAVAEFRAAQWKPPAIHFAGLLGSVPPLVAETKAMNNAVSAALEWLTQFVRSNGRRGSIFRGWLFAADARG